MKTYGYSKAEKLKQKSDIDLLFKKGKWKTSGNIRIIVLKNSISTQENPITSTKIGVSVSKKYFKKAVDRNRVKRLLREVYRLHKFEFQNKFGNNVHAMLFWVSAKLPEGYQEVENEYLKLCQS